MYEQLERQTQIYATRRQQLAELVENMKKELHYVKKFHINAIRKAVSQAVNAKSDLRVLIEENRDKFEKPKTRSFHGVKIGYKKNDGKVVIDDEEKAISRIKELYDDPYEHLIKKEEKILKNGVKKLSEKELEKIGGAIEGAGDYIVIDIPDTETDKFVDALLEEFK